MSQLCQCNLYKGYQQGSLCYSELTESLKIEILLESVQYA